MRAGFARALLLGCFLSFSVGLFISMRLRKVRPRTALATCYVLYLLCALFAKAACRVLRAACCLLLTACCLCLAMYYALHTTRATHA